MTDQKGYGEYEGFGELEQLGEGEISAVTALARRLDLANADVERAERLLDEAKRQRDVLARDVIPEAMTKIGVTELPLADGQILRVHDIVRFSVPKEKQPEAYAWLRDNGYGNLIKRKVELEFSRGQDNEAGALVAELRDRGFQPSDAETVPWNTLDAFGRELLGKGERLPPTLFNLNEFREAALEAPRKARRAGANRR